MNDELFKIKKDKVEVIKCTCKKEGIAILHKSVAIGWLVGKCSACGKQLLKKGA